MLDTTIKKFSDWAQENSVSSGVDQIREYSDYVRLSKYREGTYDEEVENQIRQGAYNQAVRTGLIAPDAPEEEAQAFQATLFSSASAPESEYQFASEYFRSVADSQNDDESRDKASIIDGYLATARFNPLGAEELRGETDALLTEDVRKSARISAVDRGDVPIVSYIGDEGQRYFYVGANFNKDTIESSLPSLIRSGALEASDLLRLKEYLEPMNGGMTTLATETRAQMFNDAVESLRKKDEILSAALENYSEDRRNSLSEEQATTGERIWGGVKAAAAYPFLLVSDAVVPKSGLSQERYDVGDPIQRLLENKTILSSFSEEEIRRFGQDYIDHTAGAVMSADRPETGVRADSRGNAIISPSLIPNVEGFELALERSPLNDEQKEEARLRRKKLLVASAPDIKKLILSEDSDAVSDYSTAKAQGRSDEEWIESWISRKGQVYSGFSERAQQFASSIGSAIAGIPVGATALFGFKPASDAMVAMAKDQASRREYSGLMGDEFGLTFDIVNTIPQVAADIFATIGLTTGVGALRKAVTTGSVRSVVRTAPQAAMASVTPDTADLVRTASTAAGSNLTSEAIRRVGQDVARSVTRSDSLIALASTSFVRSAGATYGSIMSQLPETMSYEEKHKNALGYSLAAGTSTMILVTGFSALHLGGVEDLATGGFRAATIGDELSQFSRKVPINKLSYSQMKYLTEKVLNEGKAVTDQAFKKAMRQSLSGAYKNFIRTTTKSGLSEKAEEALDSAISMKLEDAALDRNTPLVERLDQIFHAGVIGFALGSLTSSASQLTGRLSEADKQEAMAAKGVVLTDIGTRMQIENTEYQALAKFRNRLLQTGSPSTADVVQLMMDVANQEARDKQAARTAAARERVGKEIPLSGPLEIDSDLEIGTSDPSIPKVYLGDLVGEKVTVQGYSGTIEKTPEGTIRLVFDKPTASGETALTLGMPFQDASKLVSQVPVALRLTSDWNSFSRGQLVIPRDKKKFVLPRKESFDTNNDADLKPTVVRGADGKVSYIVVPNTNLFESPEYSLELRVSSPQQIARVAKYYDLDVSDLPVATPVTQIPREEGSVYQTPTGRFMIVLNGRPVFASKVQVAEARANGKLVSVQPADPASETESAEAEAAAAVDLSGRPPIDTSPFNPWLDPYYSIVQRARQRGIPVTGRDVLEIRFDLARSLAAQYFPGSKADPQSPLGVSPENLEELTQIIMSGRPTDEQQSFLAFNQIILDGVYKDPEVKPFLSGDVSKPAFRKAALAATPESFDRFNSVVESLETWASSQTFPQNVQQYADSLVDYMKSRVNAVISLRVNDSFDSARASLQSRPPRPLRTRAEILEERKKQEAKLAAEKEAAAKKEAAAFEAELKRQLKRGAKIRDLFPERYRFIWDGLPEDRKKFFINSPDTFFQEFIKGQIELQGWLKKEAVRESALQKRIDKFNAILSKIRTAFSSGQHTGVSIDGLTYFQKNLGFGALAPEFVEDQTTVWDLEITPMLEQQREKYQQAQADRAEKIANKPKFASKEEEQKWLLGIEREASQSLKEAVDFVTRRFQDQFDYLNGIQARSQVSQTYYSGTRVLVSIGDVAADTIQKGIRKYISGDLDVLPRGMFIEAMEEAVEYAAQGSSTKSQLRENRIQQRIDQAKKVLQEEYIADRRKKFRDAFNYVRDLEFATPEEMFETRFKFADKLRAHFAFLRPYSVKALKSFDIVTGLKLDSELAIIFSNANYRAKNIALGNIETRYADQLAGFVDYTRNTLLPDLNVELQAAQQLSLGNRISYDQALGLLARLDTDISMAKDNAQLIELQQLREEFSKRIGNARTNIRRNVRSWYSTMQDLFPSVSSRIEGVDSLDYKQLFDQRIAAILQVEPDSDEQSAAQEEQEKKKKFKEKGIDYSLPEFYDVFRNDVERDLFKYLVDNGILTNDITQTARAFRGGFIENDATIQSEFRAGGVDSELQTYTAFTSQRFTETVVDGEVIPEDPTNPQKYVLGKNFYLSQLIQEKFPLITPTGKNIEYLGSSVRLVQTDKDGTPVKTFAKLPYVPDELGFPSEGFFTNHPSITAEQIRRGLEVYIPKNVIRKGKINPSIKYDSSDGRVLYVVDPITLSRIYRSDDSVSQTKTGTTFNTTVSPSEQAVVQLMGMFAEPGLTNSRDLEGAGPTAANENLEDRTKRIQAGRKKTKIQTLSFRNYLEALDDSNTVSRLVRLAESNGVELSDVESRARLYYMYQFYEYGLGTAIRDLIANEIFFGSEVKLKSTEVTKISRGWRLEAEQLAKDAEISGAMISEFTADDFIQTAVADEVSRLRGAAVVEARRTAEAQGKDISEGRPAKVVRPAGGSLNPVLEAFAKKLGIEGGAEQLRQELMAEAFEIAKNDPAVVKSGWELASEEDLFQQLRESPQRSGLLESTTLGKILFNKDVLYNPAVLPLIQAEFLNTIRKRLNNRSMPLVEIADNLNRRYGFTTHQIKDSNSFDVLNQFASLMLRKRTDLSEKGNYVNGVLPIEHPVERVSNAIRKARQRSGESRMVAPIDVAVLENFFSTSKEAGAQYEKIMEQYGVAQQIASQTGQTGMGDVEAMAYANELNSLLDGMYNNTDELTGALESQIILSMEQSSELVGYFKGVIRAFDPDGYRDTLQSPSAVWSELVKLVTNAGELPRGKSRIIPNVIVKNLMELRDPSALRAAALLIELGWVPHINRGRQQYASLPPFGAPETAENDIQQAATVRGLSLSQLSGIVRQAKEARLANIDMAERDLARQDYQSLERYLQRLDEQGPRNEVEQAYYDQISAVREQFADEIQAINRSVYQAEVEQSRQENLYSDYSRLLQELTNMDNDAVEEAARTKAAEYAQQEVRSRTEAEEAQREAESLDLQLKPLQAAMEEIQLVVYSQTITSEGGAVAMEIAPSSVLPAGALEEQKMVLDFVNQAQRSNTKFVDFKGIRSKYLSNPELMYSEKTQAALIARRAVLERINDFKDKLRRGEFSETSRGLDFENTIAFINERDQLRDIIFPRQAVDLQRLQSSLDTLTSEQQAASRLSRLFNQNFRDSDQYNRFRILMEYASTLQVLRRMQLHKSKNALRKADVAAEMKSRWDNFQSGFDAEKSKFRSFTYNQYVINLLRGVEAQRDGLRNRINDSRKNIIDLIEVNVRAEESEGFTSEQADAEAAESGTPAPEPDREVASEVANLMQEGRAAAESLRSLRAGATSVYAGRVRSVAKRRLRSVFARLRQLGIDTSKISFYPARSQNNPAYESERRAALKKNTEDAQRLGLVDNNSESMVGALRRYRAEATRDERALIDLIVQFPTFIQSLNFRIFDAADETWAGAYLDNTVMLNLSGYVGKPLGGVLLHEVSHALTDGFIQSPINEEQRQAVARITQIREYARTLAQRNGRYAEWKTLRGSNPFDDNREFVTSLLTVQEFQSTVRRLDKRSILQRVFHAILRLFGVAGPRVQSVFDTAMREVFDFTRMSLPHAESFSLTSNSSRRGELVRTAAALENIENNLRAVFQTEDASYSAVGIVLNENKYADLERRAKAGDKQAEAEAQRMVEEAAKAAGYNIGPVWHGSYAFDQRNPDENILNEFKVQTTSTTDLFHFAPDRAVAKARQALARFPLSEEYLDQINETNWKSFWSEKPFYLRGRFVRAKDEDAQWADRVPEGVSGFIYDNEIETVGTATSKGDSYSVKNPSDIKSADPFTYDENGNLIPLSRRFNPESPDIRFYSAPEFDPTPVIESLVPEGFTAESDPNLVGGEMKVNPTRLDVITYNPKAVAEAVAGLSRKNAESMIRSMVDEEIAHIAVINTFSPQEIEAMAPNFGSVEGAHEYLRAVTTRLATGRVREGDVDFFSSDPTMFERFLDAVRAFVTVLKDRLTLAFSPSTAAKYSRAAREFRRLQNGGVLPDPQPSSNLYGDMDLFVNVLDNIEEEGQQDRSLFDLPIYGENKSVVDKFWDTVGVKLKLYNMPTMLRDPLSDRTRTLSRIEITMKQFNARFPKMRDRALENGVTMDEITKIFGTTEPLVTAAAAKDIQQKLRQYRAELRNEADPAVQETSEWQQEFKAKVKKRNYELRADASAVYAADFRIEQQAMEQSLRDRGFGELVDFVVEMREELNGFKVRLGFGATNDVYLTRQYRIFHTPAWMEAVRKGQKFVTEDGKEIDFAVMKEIAARSIYENKIVEEAANTGVMLSEAEISEKVMREMDDYLANLERRMQEKPDVKTLMTIRQDLDLYKPKHDVDKRLRELFGEIKDPFEVYLRTLHAVGRQAANKEFGQKFADLTIGLGLASYKPTEGFELLYRVSNDPSLGELSDLYVQSDIAAAVREEIGFSTPQKRGAASRALDTAGRAAARVSGHAILTKTSLSAGYWPRNVIGGFLISVANGNLGINRRSIQSVYASFSSNFNKVGDAEIRSEVRELAELQMVKDEAQGRMAIDMIRGFANGTDEQFDSTLDTIMGSAVEGGEKKGWAAIKSVLGKIESTVAETAANLNDFVDSYFKITAFYDELDTLKAAYPDRDLKELKVEAARKVKRTFPTHSDQLDITKAFRKSPYAMLIVPFVRWKTEIFRTMINIPMLAIDEIKTKNPVLVRRGVRRLVGFGAVLFGGTTAMSYGFSLLFSTLLADREEGEDEERRFLTTEEIASILPALPEWQRRHSLVVESYGGRLQITDMSNILPYSQLTDTVSLAVRAAKTGRSSDLIGIVDYIKNDWLGQNLAATTISELATNRTSFGSPITTADENVLSFFAKNLLHAFKGLYYPTVAKKAVEAGLIPVSPSLGGALGTPARLDERTRVLLGEATGARPNILESRDFLRRGLRQLKQDQNDAVAILQPIRSGNVLPLDQIPSILDRHQAAMVSNQERLANFLRVAERMGLPKKALYDAAKDANYSRDTVTYALRGKRIAWIPSKEFERKMIDNIKAVEEDDAEARLRAIRQHKAASPDAYPVRFY